MPPRVVQRPPSRPMMSTHGTRTGVGVCRTSWAFTHGSRLLRATNAIDTNRVQSLATRSSVVGLQCGRVLLHPADPLVWGQASLGISHTATHDVRRRSA